MARTTIPAELVAINAIQGTLIADNAITAVHIATNAVSGTLVADNAITSTHIAQNNVTATQIAQNTITVTQMADSAIETAKINNDAVTQAKIADDAVGPDQLAANAVVSASIANGTIVEADMADNAVTLAKMASLARGSIIYGDSAGDPAALSIGSNGTVLSSDGTDVSWAAASGGVDGIVSNANATAITIDSSENVGIGTSSPADKLHVKKSSTAVGEAILTVEGGSGGYGTGISFQSPLTGGSLAEMAKIVADGEAPWNTTASTQDAGLRFYTTGDGTLAERMRIDSAGNVGIGITSPGSYANDDNSLAVLGQVRIQGVTNSASVPILALRDTNSGLFVPASNAVAISTGAAERMRLTSDGVAMGDTDGDYNHRGATGGLHVKRGGILMNGPPGDANMSSGTNGNQWTYLGQGGRGGSFTSLTISVPNPNNGASGVGYGGFSLEFYIAGYNAKYHSGHFAGYVNGGITLSKRAFWDSSGSGTLSSGSVGVQGFYLTIGFPSMTHPTCKFVINKGGHGGSTGNAAWTDMDGVSITWA